MRRLQDDEDALEILCAVDVLSEGVDIPSISHILLLRPTQSFTVFLQQIGRGLRLHPGKGFVVVLDFVGNYRKRFVAPLALDGHRAVPRAITRAHDPVQFKPPAGCFVDADAEVRGIWRRELESLDPRRRSLVRIEVMLEEMAGDERRIDEVRLPELFTYSVEEGGRKDRLAAMIRNLGGWLRVRSDLGIAGDYEEPLRDVDGEAFLKHVEEELSPTKSYKMAVLHALLDDADSRDVRTIWPVDQIAPAFLSYYLANRRRTKDYNELAGVDYPREFPLAKVVAHLKKMPLDKLSNSSDKPFVLDGDSFVLKNPYVPYWREPLFRALIRERVEYAEARYWYTH